MKYRKQSKVEFEIINEHEGREDIVIFRTSSPDEREKWINHLSQHVYDHKRLETLHIELHKVYNI